MIALIVVSFTLWGVAAAPPQVDVFTDNTPAHWREWTVIAQTPLTRSERCHYRFDARRVLLHQHVTRRPPRRCGTQAVQRHRWNHTTTPEVP